MQGSLKCLALLHLIASTSSYPSMFYDCYPTVGDEIMGTVVQAYSLKENPDECKLECRASVSGELVDRIAPGQLYVLTVSTSPEFLSMPYSFILSASNGLFAKGLRPYSYCPPGYTARYSLVNKIKNESELISNISWAAPNVSVSGFTTFRSVCAGSYRGPLILSTLTVPLSDQPDSSSSSEF